VFCTTIFGLGPISDKGSHNDDVYWDGTSIGPSLFKDSWMHEHKGADVVLGVSLPPWRLDWLLGRCAKAPTCRRCQVLIVQEAPKSWASSYS
jgi:hypothetical protein